MLTLAQENADAAEGNPLLAFLPMIAIGVFFYFIMLRPQQRREKQRRELLSEIKKNDKVVTIGGIIGKVADLSSDGREVTIKVDDTTRIRLLRSSIQTIYDETAGEDSKS